MKKIKNISVLAVLAFCFFMGCFTSCNEEVAMTKLPYLFRPINFNVALTKTIATISWAAVDSAKSYTLQVSLDSVFTKPLIDTTLAGLSYTHEFAGQTQFYARVKANASDTTMNSKFNNKLAFKTPAENIFLGYGTSINTGIRYSAYMTAANTLDIKWTPGANVSHLVLSSADGSINNTVQISSSEATAGEKFVSSLSNSNWTIKIYNKTILRGTTNGIVEGDIILNAGDNLAAAITGATAGQVIVLAPGTVFPVGTATFKIGLNIKIRGLSATNRPVVCMTMNGTTPPTSSSSMLGFADQSSLDYVKFENIDFTGFCDNSNVSTKIGYLFNNNQLTTVKNLSFTNCNMHNFGNTPMRVQGSKNQVIDTLSFNGCVINEIGFSSTYAIVNSNSADFINNINFNNCTVYNFKGSLVLRTSQTLKSINIVNCSINQGMQDAGSARYLIDLNTATFVGTGGVTIKNCIFGSSGAAMGANGMRYIAGTPISITGSYYTSDYVDTSIPPGTTSTSIKANMTAYSGASTSLWNGPTTGDFTLKDKSFVGKGTTGDLRWY